ncbi:ComF family protein [Candidatus Kaiserbacteria bacterium]|nr:ComF family protein [Candidatus Kaiserbacteria bacterium]
MRLLDFLFPPRADERVVRDATPDSLPSLLAPELVALGGVNATALLPFPNELVRAAIHEAKYRGSERAFALLSSALVEYLQNADVDLRAARLVPIPLGAKRRTERGYNQVEEIAKRASRELGIPLETNVLVRTKETASQISLPRREREQNMRGAFSAAHPASQSHLYILLDDVTTTGATLSAAVSALRAAGAQNILPVALAH